MSLLERVAEAISQQQLLRPGQRVLTAVSGGPDSLCLLHALLELGYQPHVAHLDHGLRPESAAEAERVRLLAERWGLPISMERVKGSRWAEQSGSLEEAARLARYRFLVQAARKAGLETLASGHTIDDQVETILMHLLRGAGPAGLAGMRPVEALSGWQGVGDASGMRLVRPLLGIAREETQAYCAEQGLEPVRDPSNRDPRFFRNRLRHELLPVLRQYNPGIDAVLARTGQIMRTIADWVAAEVDSRWGGIVREAGEGALAFRWQELVDLPVPLQRAVLARAVCQLRPGKPELDYQATDRAWAYLEGEGDGVCALVADLWLERAGAEAILRGRGAIPTFPQVPQWRGAAKVPVPGRITLLGGWELVSECGEAAEEERRAILGGDIPYDDQGTEALDFDRVDGDLRLRTAETGDRFRPLGMAGSMPLSDFLINEKVARLQRTGWPLLVDDQRILWVVGLRLSEDARVSADTRRLLRLRLRKPS